MDEQLKAAIEYAATCFAKSLADEFCARAQTQSQSLSSVIDMVRSTNKGKESEEREARNPARKRGGRPRTQTQQAVDDLISWFRAEWSSINGAREWKGVAPLERRAAVRLLNKFTLDEVRALIAYAIRDKGSTRGDWRGWSAWASSLDFIARKADKIRAAMATPAPAPTPVLDLRPREDDLLRLEQERWMREHEGAAR